MDVSDILLLLGVIAVLLISVGIGALVALGVIPGKWILIGMGVVVALIFVVLLGLGTAFFVKKLRSRKAAAEPEPEEEPDYQAQMMDSLSERCKDNTKFLLCRIALDNLGQIKQEHGKEIVGEFLDQVEKRIIKCLKENDKLYRAEDNEYVATLESESSEDWKKRLGDVDHRMRNMFVIEHDDDETCIDTSVSIGFAIFPGMSQSAEELYKIAGDQLELSRDEVRETPPAEEPPAEVPEEAPADGGLLGLLDDVPPEPEQKAAETAGEAAAEESPKDGETQEGGE